jgi:hypothetical protein
MIIGVLRLTETVPSSLSIVRQQHLMQLPLGFYGSVPCHSDYERDSFSSKQSHVYPTHGLQLGPEVILGP